MERVLVLVYSRKYCDHQHLPPVLTSPWPSLISQWLACCSYAPASHCFDARLLGPLVTAIATATVRTLDTVDSDHFRQLHIFTTERLVLSMQADAASPGLTLRASW